MATSSSSAADRSTKACVCSLPLGAGVCECKREGNTTWTSASWGRRRSASTCSASIDVGAVPPVATRAAVAACGRRLSRQSGAEAAARRGHSAQRKLPAGQRAAPSLPPPLAHRRRPRLPLPPTPPPTVSLPRRPRPRARFSRRARRPAARRRGWRRHERGTERETRVGGCWCGRRGRCGVRAWRRGRRSAATRRARRGMSTLRRCATRCAVTRTTAHRGALVRRAEI